jgi:hypothetical protein
MPNTDELLGLLMVGGAAVLFGRGWFEDRIEDADSRLEVEEKEVRTLTSDMWRLITPAIQVCATTVTSAALARTENLEDTGLAPPGQ